MSEAVSVRPGRLVRLAGAIAPFGSLIVFWLLLAAVGVTWAIAGAVAFTVLDGLRRWHGSLGFPRVWLLTGALTVVFGAIDLAATSPFMFSYEAVITNAATGLAFIVGAGGRKSIVQELAEQRAAAFPDRADVRRFFRIFTLLWAAYFFVKAGLYFWLAQALPLTQAMAVRSVAGPLSLVLLTAFSFTQGRRLFVLCKRLGLLEGEPA